MDRSDPELWVSWEFFMEMSIPMIDYLTDIHPDWLSDTVPEFSLEQQDLMIDESGFRIIWIFWFQDFSCCLSGFLLQ